MTHPTITIENTREFAIIARASYAQTAGAHAHWQSLPEPFGRTWFDVDEQAFAVSEKVQALEKANRHAFVAVVFSAMSLESLINVVGRSATSRSFFKMYLDKLDFVAKWVVVSKLSGRFVLDRDGQTFQHLKVLAKDRNELVHSKPHTVTSFEELVAYKEKARDYRAAAENAISALDGVARIVGGADGQRLTPEAV